MNRWQVKNPLTIEERSLLQEGLKLQLNYRELGEYVGRCKSTVLREARRLGDPSVYDAKKAQNDFETKQIEKRKRVLRTVLV